MKVSFIRTELKNALLALDDDSVAKILKAIDMLEEFGSRLRPPHSKQLIKDIYELRIHGELPLRLLYTFYNNEAVILHAFAKKSQKIPQKELNTAVRRLGHLRRT